MIYIIEIPHLRPPKCWSTHTEQQAIDAINADAIRSGEMFETFDGALKYNGADLSSQIVCSSDSGALACLADDDMWQRHGGAAAHEALRNQMIRNGLIDDAAHHV